MPKVTVYIPDDLFEEARTLPDGDKTSQLVQRGLQRLLDQERDAESPDYAIRPDGAEEKILALRKKFLDEAEREYEAGYSAAVEIAEALPLWSLNRLVTLRFDIGAWLKMYVAAAREELFETSGPPIDPAKIPKGELATLLASIGGLPQPTPEQSEWWWVWRLAKVLGWLANPLDYDEGAFDPTNARVRGFTDGMRDLWDAIESPGNSRVDRSLDLTKKLREVRKAWSGIPAEQVKTAPTARTVKVVPQRSKPAEKGGDDA